MIFDEMWNSDSKHHKSKLKKSNIVEFESFPFEVLQIFGDYIYRIGRTLTVLELVQFFEFCHFLGLERVCKGQGSPNLQNNFVINGTILGRSGESLKRYNFWTMQGGGEKIQYLRSFSRRHRSRNTPVSISLKKYKMFARWCFEIFKKSCSYFICIKILNR